jgi:hypothetical protein
VVGRRQLFWAALAAGGIQLIGFVSNYLLTLATGEKGSTTLLVVAGVVSVIGGTVTLVLQNALSAKPIPPPTPVNQSRQGGGGGGRFSLIVALILMIVLCGVGGTAATSFATAVIDRLNAFPGGDPFGTKSPDKNDPLRPVLAREASASSGDLTLRVTKVEATSKEIRVSLTAINGGSGQMSLPLFKNCLLSVGSATLEADPNQSQWAISVPGHGQISGVIIFHGSVAGATGANLSFASVFRMGGGSISVEIALTTTS